MKKKYIFAALVILGPVFATAFAEKGKAFEQPFWSSIKKLFEGDEPKFSFTFNGGLNHNQIDSELYRLPGFQLGNEAELPASGFNIYEAEININTPLTPYFSGTFTADFHYHKGHRDFHIEEAYARTEKLPAGLTFQFGRFYSAIGYMNVQHPHDWDFVDAPLVYRGLFNTQYYDDGLQIRLQMPTDFYWEIGAELFAGDEFPATTSKNGITANTLFTHFGGDIGTDHSWQLGFSFLNANPKNREALLPHDHSDAHDGFGDLHHHSHKDHGCHHKSYKRKKKYDHSHDHYSHDHKHDHGNGHSHDEHSHDCDHSHDDHKHHHHEHYHEHSHHGHDHHDSGHHHTPYFFTGKSNTWGVDFVWKWAPDGNARERQLILQGEYYYRREDGDIRYELLSSSLKSRQSGGYIQAVYKFLPEWRVGVRYDQLSSRNRGFPSKGLEEVGLLTHYKPYRSSVMLDYTPDENLRFRIQYNYDLSFQKLNNEIMFQFILHLGSHGAHAF